MYTVSFNFLCTKITINRKFSVVLYWNATFLRIIFSFIEFPKKTCKCIKDPSNFLKPIDRISKYFFKFCNSLYISHFTAIYTKIVFWNIKTPFSKYLNNSKEHLKLLNGSIRALYSFCRRNLKLPKLFLVLISIYFLSIDIFYM